MHPQEAYKMCMYHMNRYVRITTTDGMYHDGFVAGVDSSHVTLAIPVVGDGFKMKKKVYKEMYQVYRDDDLRQRPRPGGRPGGRPGMTFMPRRIPFDRIHRFEPRHFPFFRPFFPFFFPPFFPQEEFTEPPFTEPPFTEPPFV